MAGTPLLLPSRLLPHSHRDMPTSRTGDLRLDAFFTTAPAGLAILDRELRYVQLNDTLALMNGRPVADHVGKSVREVLPAIAATLEPLLQRILDTGEPVLNIELSGETPAQPGVTRYWRASYFPLAARGRRGKNAAGLDRITGTEVQWKRQDGHRIIVRLSGRVVRSEKGDVRGFEMIAEDVTEQRTLERALQQAQKMETIGRLTSGIAHDFNNLLTVILAQSNLITKALPPEGSAELRRDLAELTDAARRGAELVHRLLGFSRHEILDFRPLSAPEWVREELHTLRRLLPATVEIQCDAEPEAGVVEADAGALEQILLNLATNARDAMPGGGTLYLDVRRTRLDAEDRPLHARVEPGTYVCLAVSDTGAGMDAETQARVFEPFFTTKPAGVGTGLGMAMVYGLV